MSRSVRFRSALPPAKRILRHEVARVAHLKDVATLRNVPPPDLRFVIFAQGRSGSTLLTDLLRSHPDVWCDDEILNAELRMRYRDPLARIELRSRVATRRKKRGFGFHVKIRQLEDHQGVDPAEFLGSLDRRGWRFIWLRRENVVRSALSNLVREQRGRSHIRVGNARDEGFSENPIVINPRRLVEHAHNRLAMHEAERVALGNRHCVEVVYERDLLDASQHQSTATRVFESLGLYPAPVSTSLVRLASDSLREQVANADDIESAVRAAGLGNFLDSDHRSPASRLWDRPT